MNSIEARVHFDVLTQVPYALIFINGKGYKVPLNKLENWLKDQQLHNG